MYTEAFRAAVVAKADQEIAERTAKLHEIVDDFRATVAEGCDRTEAIAVMTGAFVLGLANGGNVESTVALLAVAIAELAERETAEVA
jgi:hypothetical protein